MQNYIPSKENQIQRWNDISLNIVCLENNTSPSIQYYVFLFIVNYIGAKTNYEIYFCFSYKPFPCLCHDRRLGTLASTSGRCEAP